VLIYNSNFRAESAARFPPIMGVGVHIRFGANGDDGDGDGDGVGDIRSA
jgi:hypothetical protein